MTLTQQLGAKIYIFMLVKKVKTFKTMSIQRLDVTFVCLVIYTCVITLIYKFGL